MRFALATLMLVHGIAHLVGFVGSWWPAMLKEHVYRTTVVGGSIEIGDVGAHLVGLLWLAFAIAFISIAGLALANWPGWIPLALGTSLASFVLCIVGWPDARIGLGVNAVIFVAVLVSRGMGAL